MTKNADLWTQNQLDGDRTPKPGSIPPNIRDYLAESTVEYDEEKPLAFRIKGSDFEMLSPVIQASAFVFAETNNTDGVAFFEIKFNGNRADSELPDNSFITQTKIGWKHTVEKALRASKIGPTVLVLNQLQAIPGKHQSFLIPVLESAQITKLRTGEIGSEIMVRRPKETIEITGDSAHLAVIIAQTSEHANYDLEPTINDLTAVSAVLTS